MLCRPDLRDRILENKAETLSIAIRRRGEIFLKMSRASNNRCRFCNDAPFQDGTFWPFESLTKMIDEGIAQGVKNVFLSGGEPTLHPRFVEVIAYARHKGAERIVVITNGRRFAYPDFARAAVKWGLNDAVVAVLGRNADTHDALTQVPGSFEQTTAGIANLLATGKCRVGLSMVVTRTNVHQIGGILTLVPGVQGLTAIRVAPAGRALLESLDDLGFDVEMARAPIAEAFAIAQSRGLDFQPKLFPASFYEGHEGKYTHHEEYLPEIKDTELRTGLFSPYALRGEAIMCRGETCSVCFRAPFCDALYAFREGLVERSHTWVRCNLDEARERALLPELLEGRRLWVTARVADSIAPALAALGIESPPDIAECDALGEGPPPRAGMLIVPDGPSFSGATALDDHAILGVRLGAPAGSLASSPRVRLAVVPSFERIRDENSLGPTLEALTRQGLPLAGLPPCLAAERATFPTPDEILDLSAVDGPSSVDVVGFAHHFLRNLDRTKSARCRECVHDASCKGVHVNHARRWGLASLAPIVK